MFPRDNNTRCGSTQENYSGISFTARPVGLIALSIINLTTGQWEGERGERDASCLSPTPIPFQEVAVTYLDHPLVGHVLDLLRHDGRRGADVDVRVSGQFRKAGHAGLAVVTAGGIRADEDAYIRAGGDRSLRVLVVPEDLRRRIPVHVALQDLGGAVMRFHGYRRVPKLRAV